jgi:predicted SnoaL-like aldol condensation-catalyzing enzyme
MDDDFQEEPMSARTRRISAAAASAAVLVAGLSLAGATGPAAAESRSDGSTVGTSASVVAHKVAARQVVEALAHGQASRVARYLAPGYVDHTLAGQGTAALLASVRADRAAHPQARTRIYRMIAQGDLVFVHSNLILDRGTRGYAVADVFRFVDGRIVERWGARQAVPATTVSGNDMFSTLSSPRRYSPDPTASTEQTQATLFGLFGALVVNKDLGAWDTYAQDPYFQHSVNTANGIAAVKQVWGPLLVDPDMTISLVNIVAEGDLIVAQDVLRSPTVNLHAFDISRVQNGKVVEHWDVLEPAS